MLFSRWVRRLRVAHPDHHTIARGMAWVALFVFIGKLAGAAKEMAIAYRYGVSAEVDGYLFVFNLISLPVGVWFSVLTVVLVPLAARMRQGAAVELPHFRSEHFGLTILLGLTLTLLGWLGLPLLLRSSWMGLPYDTANEVGVLFFSLGHKSPIQFLQNWMSAQRQEKQVA